MASSGKRMSSFDEEEQDDDYWNNSKNKSKLFHEEDEENEDAKRFAKDGRKSLFDDDEDNDSLGGVTETITEPTVDTAASSSAVRYQKAGSARTQTTGSFTSSPSPLSLTPPLSTSAQLPPTHSLCTPQAWADTQPLSITADKPGLFLETDHYSKKVAPKSIQDAVASTVRQPTKADIAKLETKIKRLEIQLENQSVGSLAVEETIKRMLCGKPYLLESYRKHEDKKYLLKCALATHDGNTINSVLRFLKETLTQSLFQSTLLEVGGAEQYVSYLMQVEETSEAEDIVSMIGKSEDAAMTRYRSVSVVSQVDSKVRLLKNCLSSHFELEPTLVSDQMHVRNQISLLEVQQIIEKADVFAEAQGKHPVMRLHKRKGTLPNQPMLTTLYYCCLYHYDQPESQFCSPKYLMNQFKLSEVQMQWVATAALSRLHRWQHVEQLFTGKNWYGGSTKSSAIGFHNVVKLLTKTKSTPDIINKYCALISDEEERLRIAMKYKCNQTIIDTLVSMKDKSQLLQFKRTLPIGSLELQKVDAVLRNSSIKWKT